MTAVCTSCGAAIVWCVTADERMMPVDADVVRGEPLLDRSGNLEPTGRTVPTDKGAAAEVRVVPVGVVSLFGDDGPRWRPHWALCPDADTWRAR